jgi:hypothetical protein
MSGLEKLCDILPFTSADRYYLHSENVESTPRGHIIDAGIRYGQVAGDTFTA